MEISFIHIQKQLIYAGLDDFTPNAALPNFLGGQYGEAPEKWKAAVIDFLCISYQNNLIEIFSGVERMEISSVEQLRNLLTNGSNGESNSLDFLWNTFYFHASPKLIGILDEMNLRNWYSFNDDENSDLKNIFNNIFYSTENR